MHRGMMVAALCFAAAMLVFAVPQQGRAGDSAQKRTAAAEGKKDEAKDAKEKDGSGDVRKGINRAYDGFKKESAKGKKNLNELYEREWWPLGQVVQPSAPAPRPSLGPIATGPRKAA